MRRAPRGRALTTYSLPSRRQSNSQRPHCITVPLATKVHAIPQNTLPTEGLCPGPQKALSGPTKGLCPGPQHASVGAQAKCCCPGRQQASVRANGKLLSPPTMRFRTIGRVCRSEGLRGEPRDPGWRVATRGRGEGRGWRGSGECPAAQKLYVYFIVFVFINFT